jgi:hypothetical protein
LFCNRTYTGCISTCKCSGSFSHTTTHSFTAGEESSRATFTVPTTTDQPSSTLDYFSIMVIIAGVIGTFANGLVLYVLCTLDEIKKNMTNILFINQMAADLFSCFMLVVVFSVKASNIFLQGTGGYWLCCLLISEDMLWFGLNESIMNLASITIERYIMIVHPTWHKNFFRLWMIYGAIIFTWFASILINVAAFFPTTVVINGECFPLSIFPTPTASVIFGIWNSVSFFLIEFVIFVYCYSHILYVLHCRHRVLASQSVNPTNVTDMKAIKDMRLQMNIIKTMIIVTAVFVLSWLPNNVYFMMFFSNPDVSVVSTGYDTTILIAFFNVCINPFIYAGKYEVIRGRCFNLITCNLKYSKNPHNMRVGTVLSTTL